MRALTVLESVVNFQLPRELLELLQTGDAERVQGSWPLKNELDSFGFKFESELSQIYSDLVEMSDATTQLSSDFVEDGYYGNSEIENYPNAMLDIVDFSKIVCFGCSGDGSAFCLDYRENQKNPSVIWWDDTYWRLVAPSFKDFIALFNFNS